MDLGDRYTVGAEIHASSESRVVRARRRADGAAVVVKMLADAYPTAAQRARFEREHEVTQRLSGPGIPKVLGFESAGLARAIVLTDEGAESLARSAVPLALDVFFPFAHAVSKALARVHDARFIHKDVTPANVVLNANRGLVQLIDFGLATELSREFHAPARPQHLEGTLHYLSPEQTGRMNRGVDYRSDYYGLGATLFYALTGTPPFPGDDPIEIVHAHIARPAPLAQERNAAVPPALSAIVERLMAKAPEQRYQSLAGLAHDLERCERAIAAGAPEIFTLGEHDRSERFAVSEKLVGRERELAALTAAYTRARAGSTELVVLPGPPGIGKSSLVRELLQPVAASRGRFASGKFEQFHRGIPFDGLLQALRSLLRQMLADPPAALARHHDTLRAALGPNVSVLADVLPELALLAGTSEPLAALPPGDAQNRFELAFQNLVETIASREHPLVLVLDDLQWADLSSVRLLARLATAGSSAHLLIAAAFRDEEVDTEHPLRAALRDAEERGARVETIPVRALTAADVRDLVAASLLTSPEEIEAFAHHVFDRTRGNPFFVGRVLSKLHHDGAIAFDAARGCFRAAPDAAANLPVADNVVAVLEAAISALPGETRRVLSLAACIGSEFELDALASLTEAPRRATADALFPALAEGLVEPTSGAYRTVADEDTTRVTYRFAHDRVQQAAYDAIGEEERARHHHRAGERMLAELAPRDREARLFEIVTHLNKGASLRVEQRERDALADLDVEAAARAMRSTAFGPAWDLFARARDLRGPLAWSRDYEGALSLATRSAEAAAFAGDTDAMEKLVAEVEREARTLLDKVRARDVRIQAYVLLGRQEEAIEAGLASLRELGVRMPDAPSDLSALPAIGRATLARRLRSPEALLDQPPMQDPKHLAAMRTLMLISSSIYVHRPKLVPVVAMRQVELSLRHGAAPESPYAYVTYGLILAAVLGDVPLGYRFGRLGLALVERPQSAHLKARVTLMAAWLTEHWVKPLREVSDLVRSAWSEGLESGDLEYAMYSAVARTTFNLFGARPLPEAVEEGRGLLRIALRSRIGVARPRIGVALQAMTNLVGPSDDPARLEGDFFHGDRAFADPGAEDPQAILTARIFRAQMRWLDERYDEAAAELDAGRPLLGNYVGACLIPMFHALDALVDVARQPAFGRIERARTTVRIEANLRRMRGWAKHAPENYAHKVAVIEAERAALAGDGARATDAFDRAIRLTRQAALANEEAIACERAAIFHRRVGRETIALAYLGDARRAWRAWGAEQRARDVEARNPALLEARIDLTRSTSSSSQGIAGAVVSRAFDASAVLKSSQAIAEQTELPILVSKVLSAALEHSGARRAALVLERDGALRVTAVLVAGGEAPALTLEGAELGDTSHASDAVPATIVRYAMRTSEAVVLDDALAPNGPFGRDVWVAARRARSLLALPLLRQGRTVGALLLDNDLAPAVFTHERLDALRVVAAQAAIAIDNTVLNAGLKSALARQVALTAANQRFVPREFLSALGKDSIVEVELGDSVQKELSVLFSDMREFTKHVEGNTPEDNVGFINEYLAAMEPALIAQGGFVDSYIGDAIMALFEGTADRALLAAISMLKSLARYNHGRAERGAREVRVGIGITTGVVTLGTIGGPKRIKCGVIGDAVNLGARVESLTKIYRLPLLVSGQTVERITNPEAFSMREIDRVRVVGMRAPVTLYEVFDADPEERRDRKLAASEAWTRALRAADERDFRGAIASFDACAGLLEGDTAWSVRRARAAAYAEHPPPVGWDAVEELTQK